MPDTDLGWKIMKWFVKCFNQYADFSSRARRSEYWYFFLFNVIIAFVAGFVFGFIGGITGMMWISYLSYIYTLVALVPGIAVCVRRLHDVGKSGWWVFISLIPLAGAIWLVVLMCTDSQPGTNQWGPNPKGM